MRAKSEQKSRARIMRCSGMSIREIARQVGVAHASVSVWTKDIKLTEEQKKKLVRFDGQNQKAAAIARRRRAEERRQGWQDIGRKMPLLDPAYVAGCMLYWAEGSKSRNVVEFTNSDQNMMKLFLDFLRRYFGVTSDFVTISINCHLNNGITIDRVHRHWLEVLSLPASCIRTPTIRTGRSFRKRILLYGICRLRVSSTSIVQRIFGSIQSFAGAEIQALSCKSRISPVQA